MPDRRSSVSPAPGSRRGRGERERGLAFPANDQIRAIWADRIAAEYTSAAIAHQVVLWLLQLGASPDLVRLGLRIVDDELAHAELSTEAFVEAGGVAMPVLPRERLGLERMSVDLEDDTLCAIVRYFCLGETIAVPLFSHLRKHAKVPVVRRALDRILRDEVRHRDFGWLALEWLLAQPHLAQRRAVVEARLGGFLAELDATYGNALDNAIASVTEAERAWGVATAAEFAAILEHTKTVDWPRRFGAMGIRWHEPPTSG